MLLYNAPKNNQGFTLIEMIITVIIIGVIAAIAAPNFLGLLNRNRANSGIAQIEGAIREAQRQAIKDSNSCTVNITSATRTVSGGCLLSNRVLDNNVTINSDQSITFSGKGNTANNATIVVSTNNNTVQKCIVVSSGLGLIRKGDFDGTNCN
ncbi:MAG: GspH/FimT family protein [Cyanobacteria bacterium P01_G01_bin.67]